jgi:hypothetical protein
MKTKLGCPLCPDKFGSAAGLEFHMREGHPGNTDAAREILRAAYHERDLARKQTIEREASKKVDAIIEMGCPCGRSRAAHLAERKRLGAVA